MYRQLVKLNLKPLKRCHSTKSFTSALTACSSMDPVTAFKQHLFTNRHSSLKSTPFRSALHSAAAPVNEKYSSSLNRPPLAKKVLVVGSGGLSIGQAGEFDYSGSQAIKALKEEGVETILINPNIATVQTAKDLADTVYFLPINPEYIEHVIKKEAPDAILLTFGGQSALNCGIALSNSGVLAKYNVKVLGTPIRTLEISEDRDLFAKALKEINIPVAESVAVESVEDALAAASKIGYPIICRSAFALGGLGSGFAANEKELRHLATTSLSLSPQILVEKSMKGWKEVEYEVVRDADNNCITVCNMENFNPLGVHTGDSIVVAPSQTLSDEEYHMLRTAAIKIIRHLGVVGECNVQYGLDPVSLQYFVIEVNARLSRSSALASKATGYPLAFVAAKIGLGATLPELKNAVTKTTTANFEPSLDYVVTKIPRWDLGKFQHVARDIGSSMKSVGEVMAIGRTFEESIQKAIRQIEPSYEGLHSIPNFPPDFDLEHALRNPTDRFLFVIAHAMINKDYTVDSIHEITKVDKWFLYKLENIINLGNELKQVAGPVKLLGSPDQKSLPLYTLPPLEEFDMDVNEINGDLLLKAKQLGFSDKMIGILTKSSELGIRALRRHHSIFPRVKRIDTLAGEFPANTNYLYTSYNCTTDDITFEDKGVMVLGSGVYRIGSSVEFDWCGVSCIRSLRKTGTKTIMVNYNPETVSTDFDECDRLYFEELSFERVMDIYERENSTGVIVSVGGQLPQNIALKLWANHVKILGTSPVDLDRAEDRYKFSTALDNCGIDQPAWKELSSVSEAESFADSVGYPVLIRPSYVLSGAAMNVAYDLKDLHSYLALASDVSPDHPVVITKFIQGAQEIDVDAVGKNGELVVYAVSQHVENAGVHSGDATLVLPPTMEKGANASAATEETFDVETGVGLKGLNETIIQDCKEIAVKVAKEFNISGPFNMQIILQRTPTGHTLKVIECNLRASRSFPFVSKVMNTDFVDVATRSVMNYKSLQEIVPKQDLMTIPRPYVAVKAPVFSWTRLAGADPTLGVEMASTGEVACFGKDVKEAFFTAYLSNHNNFKQLPMPAGSGVLIGMDELSDKNEVVFVGKNLDEMGYKVYTDSNELQSLYQSSGIKSRIFIPGNDEAFISTLSDRRIARELFTVCDIKMAVSFSKIRPRTKEDRSYMLRRCAVDFGVGLVNESKTAVLLIQALKEYKMMGREKEGASNSWQAFVGEASIAEISKKSVEAN